MGHVDMKNGNAIVIHQVRVNLNIILHTRKHLGGGVDRNCVNRLAEPLLEGVTKSWRPPIEINSSSALETVAAQKFLRARLMAKVAESWHIDPARPIRVSQAGFSREL